MERKLLEAMSREEPLSLPAADSSPTEGSLWQAGQANLDEEGLMGRQMPGSAAEGSESLTDVLSGEQPIGEKEISEAMAVLEKYKSAKASLDKRIIDNEEWYKLGHWKQYGNRVMEGKRAPSTGWLFNSIANKHADAMDNYPEPNVLPRAQDDEETAKLLSDILPVVLEQADYESVYSDTWWRKLKQGTGVKGIFWDPALREGLGDIAIRSMDLLMLYWEPGVEDIQDSADFFSLALADNDRLTARWPQLEGKASPWGSTSATGTSTPAKRAWWWTGITSGRSPAVRPWCITASSATAWCSTPARTTRRWPRRASMTTENTPLCLTRSLWKRTARRASGTST